MKNTITCPKCDHEFEATEALTSKIEKDTELKYAEKYTFLEKSLKEEQLKTKDVELRISEAIHKTKLDFMEQEKKLKEEAFQLKQKSELQQQELNQKYEQDLQLQKVELTKQLTSKFNELKDNEIALAVKEAEEKIIKISQTKNETEIQLLKNEVEIFKQKEASFHEQENDLKQRKAEFDNKVLELENKLREKDIETQLIIQKVTLENDRKILDMKKQIITDVEARANEELQRKLQEKDIALRDGDERLKRMQVKIEELQRQTLKQDNEAIGEAFENYVQAKIENKFPLDKITAVPKGVNGVDIQIDIMSNGITKVGNILIECKYASNWNNSWIEKANKNRRDANADMVIIITKALPSSIEKFGLLDNVFIVDSLNYLQILPVLRSKLEDMAKIKLANENKHSKLEQLFSYLSSQDFSNLMEHAINSTKSMQDQLDKDRKASSTSFKSRQSEIDHIKDVIIEFQSTIESKITVFDGCDAEIESHNHIKHTPAETKELPYLETENDQEDIAVVVQDNETVETVADVSVQIATPINITKHANPLSQEKEISIGIFEKHFKKIGDNRYTDSTKDTYILVKKDEKWATISKIVHLQ